GVFAVACLAIAAMLGYMPPLRSLWEPVVQGPGFRVFFINNVYRFIALCLIAQALDTYVVLRKFAKKEAEHRRALETALHQADAAEKPSEAIMEKKTGIVDKQGGEPGV